MLKNLTVALAVTSALLVSPALAKKPDAPVKCVAPETFTKSAKPLYDLTGDDLARFRAKVEELTHTPIPIKETDHIMIAGDEGAPFYVGVMFVKGCAKGIFLITPKAAEKAAAPAETL